MTNDELEEFSQESVRNIDTDIQSAKIDAVVVQQQSEPRGPPEVPKSSHSFPHAFSAAQLVEQHIALRKSRVRSRHGRIGAMCFRGCGL